MHKIISIAHLTALEMLRNRVIPGALLTMPIILATATLLASVTMGSTVQIVVDLGFASISILANLVAIVLTIQLAQQEVEKKTLYILIPRLPSRLHYVLGKYIGIAGVASLLVIFMSLMLALACGLMGWHDWYAYTIVTIATIFEVWIIVAVALLFSNATSFFLAILFTLSADVAGRFVSVIKAFGEKVGGGITWLTDLAYYLLPNLERLNIRNHILDVQFMHGISMATLTLYTIVEAGLLLGVCALLYLKRDLQG